MPALRPICQTKLTWETLEMPIERLNNGANISYFDNGNANDACQTLVFVHGWGLNGDVFWAQHELGNKYRIIIPDLRGCGKSINDDKNITIEDLGCDVFLLIEKLQLKNVHIVAWSMGAMAIWCAFQNYQNENINSYTFIDMSPKISNEIDWENGILGLKSLDTEIGRERFEKSIQNMRNDWNNFANRMVGRILANGEMNENSTEIYNKLYEISKNADAEIMAHLWCELSECDARKNIALNEIPSLLIYGLKNQLYSNKVGEYVAANMPNSFLVQFANSGHAPHLEEATSFNKILDGFIESVIKIDANQTNIKFLINEENKGNGSFFTQIGQ